METANDDKPPMQHLHGAQFTTFVWTNQSCHGGANSVVIGQHGTALQAVTPTSSQCNSDDKMPTQLNGNLQ